MISNNTQPGDQPCLMLQATTDMVTALATDKPRRTATGEAWRSAMAPKINGETSAARAEVAKA